MAVGHKADRRGHRIREIQMIGSHQAIRHDSDTVPPGRRRNRRLQVDRRCTLQHLAEPGHVVKAAANPEQTPRLDETQQGLVNGLPVSQGQESVYRALDIWSGRVRDRNTPFRLKPCRSPAALALAVLPPRLVLPGPLSFRSAVGL